LAGDATESLESSFSGSKKQVAALTSGSLSLIGDPLGQHTGDRGEVLIRCDAGAWAITFDGIASVLVEGVVIEPQNAKKPGSGILTGDAVALLRITNCEFRNLESGVHTAATAVELDRITLSGNQTGILSTAGRITCVDSTIAGGKLGIHQTEGSPCTVERTVIRDAVETGLSVTGTTVTAQSVVLNGVTLERCGIGLSFQARSDATLSVTDSTFTANTQHGQVAWNALATVTGSQYSGHGGHGVLHIDGPATITDCRFSGNKGYGIRVEGDRQPVLAELTALSNTAVDNAVGLGAWNVRQSRILQNIVVRNGYGLMTRASGGTASIWNNTLVDNSVGVWHGGGQGRLTNNIVTFGDRKAATRDAWGIYVTEGRLDHDHNLLFGQSRKHVGIKPGPGDVIKPPRFVDHAAGDYRLAAGSPAINAGTRPDSALEKPLADRIDSTHGAVEVGAFPYTDKSGSVRILDWTELAADR